MNVNRRVLWCALLFLFVPLSFIPFSAARVEAAEPPPDVRGLATEFEAAKQMFRSRKYANATKAFKAVVTKAEQLGDTATWAESLSLAARGHLIQGDAKGGAPWLEKAKALLVREDGETNLPSAWATYLGVRGRFEWKGGDKPTATKTFVTMYDYCNKHKLFNKAVDAAHMVAITGTNEQQLVWAKKGIAAAEAGKLESWLGPLWNNLGVTRDERGEFKLALEAYTKARHYHWKGTSEIAKLAADWAVGKTHRRLGDQEKAGMWLRPVLAWAERLHAEKPSKTTKEWVGWACNEMGERALALGKKNDARGLLKRAKKHLEPLGVHKWDPKAWKRLGEALELLEESVAESAK